MLKLSSIFLLTCVLCLLCYINLSSVKNSKVSFYSLVAKSCVVAILIWKSQLQASCSIPQGQKASGPNSCLCVTVVNWWAFLNNWPKPRKLSDCGDMKLGLSSSHAPRGDVLPHLRACLRKLGLNWTVHFNTPQTTLGRDEETKEMKKIHIFLNWIF